MNHNNIMYYKDLLLNINKKELKDFIKCIKCKNKYSLIKINVYSENKSLNNIQWSKHSKLFISNGNAGGSSLMSEVLSYEIFSRICNGVLYKSEKELEYIFPEGPLSDYTIHIENDKLYSISVTRAFCYYNNFNKEKCYNLLFKKFAKIKYIEKNIKNKKIYKNILHVFTISDECFNIIKDVYSEIPLILKKNIVFVVTITNIKDIFRY